MYSKALYVWHTDRLQGYTYISVTVVGNTLGAMEVSPGFEAKVRLTRGSPSNAPSSMEVMFSPMSDLRMYTRNLNLY